MRRDPREWVKKVEALGELQHRGHTAKVAVTSPELRARMLEKDGELFRAVLGDQGLP